MLGNSGHVDPEEFGDLILGEPNRISRQPNLERCVATGTPIEHDLTVTVLQRNHSFAPTLGSSIARLTDTCPPDFRIPCVFHHFEMFPLWKQLLFPT
jgi:hypothetical protein